MPIRVLGIALVFAGLFQSAGIQRVAWLQGCWRLTSPTRIVEENWMGPRGRSMLGVSRTVRADTLAEYELVIVRQIPGGLAYEAHPSGQPSARFPARLVTDSAVVFEHTGHDFPQRIGYTRMPGDSLLAWIEGTVRGSARRVEFRYGRVRCPE